jgi:hypothetical protein
MYVPVIEPSIESLRMDHCFSVTEKPHKLQGNKGVLSSVRHHQHNELNDRA